MSGKSKLTRSIHKMPEHVFSALEQRSLLDAYKDRPAYQQNDYIGWINAAKLVDTKQKRLDQMLEELERGGVYMKMDHPPSKRA